MASNKKKINVTISKDVLRFIEWYCEEEVESKSGLIEKYFKKLMKRYEKENSAWNQFVKTLVSTQSNEIDIKSDCLRED